MSDSAGLIAHNWGFAIFLLGVVGLCAFMLGLSSLLGSKAWGRAKNEPFESGMLPVGSARLRLSAKFYLVAMLFVIDLRYRSPLSLCMVCVRPRKRLDRIRRSTRFHSNSVGRSCLPMARRGT